MFDNSAGTLNLGGSLTLGNNFVAGMGLVNYGDTVDGQTILDLAYYNLTLTDGDKVAATGFDVTNNLTFAGVLALNVQADTITVGGLFTHGDGSIEYSEIADGQAVADLTYFDLILSGGDKVAATGFDVANDLTFNSALALDIQTGTITVAGTFTHGSGSVKYSDANPGQVIADLAYYDLNLEGGGDKTGTDITVGNDLTIDGATTVSITGNQNVTNDLNVNGASVLNIAGSLITW